MTASPIRLAAVLLTALVLAGCAAEGPLARPSAQADASGPRALLAAWHRSLAGGDKTPYVGCFVGSKEELVVALAVFEAVQAGYEFHRAVTAAYGAEGWQVFQQAKGARVDLFPNDPAWPGTITVVRTDRIAFGYLPRGRVPMHMSLIEGTWRIHAGSLVPPGFDARRGADYLFRWAATLRELIPQIAAGQVAADKAHRGVEDDFKARLRPEEQPAAAAAIEAFLSP